LIKAVMHMVKKVSNSQQGDWQHADPRVLGQILAAQNILFALSDTIRIAEFYAQTLILIPGITACRVCLGDRSVQAGEMESGVCAKCEKMGHMEAETGTAVSHDSNFKCNLAEYPDVQFVSIDSYEHHFGFFAFKINNPDVFMVYHPFIGNLSNYVAITLENRLQKDLLLKARDELELKVEKRTQDLAAVNERFSLAASAARLGLWDWDIQKNELVWDEGMFQLYGIKRDEFAGAYEAWLKGVHPEDRARSNEISKVARSGDGEYDAEFRVVWPDGSVHYLKAYGKVVSDTHGRPSRMTGINYDITEQKRAEEALRQSEAKFLDLYENAPCAYFSLGTDTTIRLCNRHAEELLDYTREELTGKPVFELYADQPEGKEKAKKVFERFLSKEPIVDEELQMQRADGSPVWVSLTLNGICDSNGQLVGSRSMIMDITDRKQAEEQLHLLDFALDHVGEAAFLTDENGLFQFVNEESCRILGYTRAELLGLGVTDIDPDFPMDRWFSHWKDLKTQGSLTFEGRHKSRDGLIFPVEINANYFEYGGQGYNLALIRDITERKQAEQERLANLRFLESMDQVNRAIQGTNDLEQMMRDVLDASLSLFDCDRAWLFYPCDPDAPSFRVPMEVTKPEYPGASILNIDLPMPQDMAKDLREALDCFGPVPFTAGTAKPVNKASADQFGVKSMLMIALRPKSGNSWAFGLHQCSHPRVWTNQEERLFREIGRRLEDALTSLLTYRNLEESEAKLSEAERIAHIGYWERELDADRITLSAEAYRIFGLSQEEPFSNLADWNERWLQLIHPDDRSRMSKAAADALQGDSVYDVEYRVIQSDGEVRIVHAQGVVKRDESGRAHRAFGTMQDVTEQKRSEAALRRLNRELKALSNCNQALLRAVDERTLVEDICRIICDDAGYCLSWVGYAESDVAKTVRPVAWAGFDSGYVASTKLTWADDTELGRGPAGNAIRSGETVYVQDIATDPQMAPWRKNALQRGYRSGIALPLKDQSGGVFGVLLIYHSEPKAMTSNEIQLMEELAGDLAFGIVTLRTRIERNKTQIELQRSTDLLRAIIGAAPTAIIGLDLDGKVQTLWNPAAEKMLGWSAQEVMGRTLPSVPVESQEQFRSFREAMRSGKTLDGVEVRRQRRDGSPIDYSIYASPLRDAEGRITGNICVLVDITERKQQERVRLARLRLLEFADAHTLEELLQATLDKSEALTNSQIGFYHFLGADQETLSLQAWSTNTVQNMCTAEGKGLHYNISEAGVWVDCIRERRAVIHNDYADLTHRRGMPPGHAPVIRELVVPVFRGSQIVAILGVGNKPGNYDAQDVSTVSLLADLAWDIAERKLAQEALKASEVRFRQLYDEAPVAMYASNRQGGVVSVNAKCVQLLGYCREDLLGSLPETFLTSDSGQRLPRIREAFWSQGRLSDIPLEIVRKDGSTRDIIADSVALEDSLWGQVVLTGFRDVTEQKEAEEALSRSGELLRLVFENMNSGLLVLNNRQEMVLANSYARSCLAITDGIIDRPLLEAFPDCNALLRDALPWEHKQTVVTTPEKMKKDIVFNSSLTPDKDLRIVLFKDVTLILQNEERRKRAEELAVVGELAARLSHEIKNPLASILLGLQTVETSASLCDEDRLGLRLVLDEAWRLKETLNHVIEAACPFPLSPSLLQLDHLLKSCLDIHALIAKNRGVNVELIGGPTDLYITADLTSMRRVLTNLIQNALEACGKGDTIRVGWRRIDGREKNILAPDFPGTILSIFVEDTGPGIPEDVSMSTLFKPFFTTKNSGTGLGLAVVRDLVERQGGVINAHSSGNITSFEILFPEGDRHPCWKAPFKSASGDPDRPAKCESCQVQASRAGQFCWTIKGQAVMAETGQWPEACLECPVFREGNLSFSMNWGAVRIEE
jgi:PAS domain S-box-containing protein